MGLVESFPDEARVLLDVRGNDFVDKLGLESVREIVLDVLCGINVRGATEQLTRRRLALLNAALLATIMRAEAAEALPEQAEKELAQKPPAPHQRLLLWALGLTGKQKQNVLRSDLSSLDEYVETYRETVAEAGEEAERAYGKLSVRIALDGKTADIGWKDVLLLLSAMGSQTLAIRGSEKSLYGKLFEKLVLGSLLHALGFTLISSPHEARSGEQDFWLSSRGAKRESDATAVLRHDSAVRFDIGFIGVGNTEISLDKVSRFEREAEMAGEKRYVKTIILVDRIGSGSRITDLAGEIDGVIVQMSTDMWPVMVGAELEKLEGAYESPLRGVAEPDLRHRLTELLQDAPLEQILSIVAAKQVAPA